jgi:hypothetical protein
MPVMQKLHSPPHLLHLRSYHFLAPVAECCNPHQRWRLQAGKMLTYSAIQAGMTTG